MTIYEVLQSTGLPCVYSHFVKQNVPEPPFLAYLGNGQDTFLAEDTVYYKKNQYQIEYYFTRKNEATEELIEQALLDAGLIYDKSEDVYIQDEEMFVIYYYV